MYVYIDIYFCFRYTQIHLNSELNSFFVKLIIILWTTLPFSKITHYFVSSLMFSFPLENQLLWACIHRCSYTMYRKQTGHSLNFLIIFQISRLINVVKNSASNFPGSWYLIACLCFVHLFVKCLFVCLFWGICLQLLWPYSLAYGLFLRIMSLNISQEKKT